MTDNFHRVFGAIKPVIAMVHFGALPGSPLYDAKAGLEGLVEGVLRILGALQAAGFDAVMFGNENDRPYEFKVDTASTATMAYVIGAASRQKSTVPFGVNVLWDPMSAMALGGGDRRVLRPRDLHRHLCLGHGAVDARMPAAAMRYRDRLGRTRPGAALQHLGRVRLVARPAAAWPTARGAPSSPRSPTRSWSPGRSPARRRRCPTSRR